VVWGVAVIVALAVIDLRIPLTYVARALLVLAVVAYVYAWVSM
jgi:hypothetical protein